MDNKPLISILTPVFNHRDFIEQTIKSVLSQTYHNWEWIILDDGSTDGTGDIINSIKDSRIQYTLQEHAGINHLTKTYNKALAMCNGDLIATLDGDDYWPKYKLDVQVKSFDDPNIILSYGECFLINSSGKKKGYFNLPEDSSIAGNNPRGTALRKLLVENDCFITGTTVMYRKSALLSIGGFMEVEGIGEDFPTWVRLSLEGTFSAIPICLGYYRKHASSISFSKNQEYYFENKINFLRKFVHQNGQKLYDLGLSFDINKLERHWNKIKKFIPYNRALYLLMFGSFNDAKVEFKRFLEKDHSMKSKIIYALIVLSSCLRIDLVNPLAYFKCRSKIFLKIF